MTQQIADPAMQMRASLWSDPFLGGLAQSGNSGAPARTNGVYIGFGGLTDGALAATGVCAGVAIPVVPGDVISAINLPIGATAGATMTHQFAALYSGIATPARLAQSTDTTSAAIAASATAVWTLATPVTITSTNAPNGFVYASIGITASTIPTAAVGGTATGINYQWFSSAPLFWSFTHGSAVGATAPATIASAAAKAVAPIVILT